MRLTMKLTKMIDSAVACCERESQERMRAALVLGARLALDAVSQQRYTQAEDAAEKLLQELGGEPEKQQAEPAEPEAVPA